MDIAICDDNSMDARNLAGMLKGEHSYQIYSSAEELLFELEEQGRHFDLYLLDIFMGKMNGVQLGEHIRKADDDALICYISSSQDYYAEAFALYAFQYLLKPVSQEDFDKLLRRASELIAWREKQSIRLSHRGRVVSIPYGKILYISSMGHTIFVHCRGGHIERQTGRLDEFIAGLDPSVFMRCHQSYAVNLYNVTSLESDCFFCEGERVPISRRYLSVKERYRTLLFSEMN